MLRKIEINRRFLEFNLEVLLAARKNILSTIMNSLLHWKVQIDIGRRIMSCLPCMLQNIPWEYSIRAFHDTIEYFCTFKHTDKPSRTYQGLNPVLDILCQCSFLLYLVLLTCLAVVQLRQFWIQLMISLQDNIKH